VTALLGVGDDPRFATFADRMANREALEAIMVAWCAERTQAEVLQAFTEAEAAIGPVMDMAERAQEVAVVFNNNHGDFALRSAARFGDLLADRED
jgi:crotonobetainyl-CoA:carnitine CoA-transferase CaiB-like acyl-CoA transferase